MSELTRRSFLKQGGTTAAAAGALVVMPKALGSKSKAAKPAARSTKASAAAVKEKAAHTLVVHVPDTNRSELRVFVGNREVVIKDRDLVTRLARVTH